MRHIGLAKLAYNGDFLGWHPTVHSSVVDQGGSWSIHAYWHEAPTNLADDIGVDFDCVVSVTDDVDIERLVDFLPLQLTIEKHGDLLSRLENVTLENVSLSVKSSIQIAGIYVSTKDKTTLRKTLHKLLGEEEPVDIKAT